MTQTFTPTKPQTIADYRAIAQTIAADLQQTAQERDRFLLIPPRPARELV
jgi:hypothetical protein